LQSASVITEFLRKHLFPPKNRIEPVKQEEEGEGGKRKEKKEKGKKKLEIHEI